MKLTKRAGEVITRGRLWRWWTIENWKDAADIALKFAAILGAIAAANFFVLKPDIDWTVTYCLAIDFDTARASYSAAGKAIPGPISNLDDVLTCEIDRLPRDSIPLANFNSAFIEEAIVEPSQALQFMGGLSAEISIPEDVEALYRDHYGLTGEVWDDRWTQSIPAVAEC